MTTSKEPSIPDSIRLFLDDLGRYPLPGPEEQVALAKRVAAGDSEAKREMVAANLRLVVHWARRYQDRGVDFADLVQEGTFGLMRAVEKFDWRRGFRFSTYATWWIRQALQRAVQQHGSTIRVPMEVAESASKVDRTAWELTSEVRRHPSDDEIAEASGIDAGTLRGLRGIARVVASLDQPATSDSATTFGELVAQAEDDFVDGVESRMVVDALRHAVEDLDPLERDVIRARFGLAGQLPASLQTTATMLGIGVRKARQAEADALRRLASLPSLQAAHRAA